VRQIQKTRGGFTLVELLVVIGIIALLISMLMPALNRVRDQANRIKCMSNLRQVMQGVLMYCTENKGYMPMCNWAGYPAGHIGWLYKDPATADPRCPETGVVFSYMKNLEIFKCPLHTQKRSSGITETYTSYLMNGGIQDYGASPLTVRVAARLNKFQVNDMILWESGETNLMSPPFNDGSSYPNELISERHGQGWRMAGNTAKGSGGGILVCTDAHTEWMSTKEYDVELRKDPRVYGYNRMWIAPNLNTPGPRGFR
jgi:prepilin-type N-terminal cleavage/methylation domain-containing protein